MVKTVAVVLGLLPVLAAQERNPIRVRVVDSVRESGIAGASVEFRTADGKSSALRATTGTAGTVTISDVAPGIYRAHVSKDGFEPLEASGTEVAWQNSPAAPELVLVLVERSSIAGRVIDDDGKPMPRVLLEITRPNRDVERRFAMTDDEGLYRFDGLAPGTYWLRTQPRPTDGELRAPAYYPGDRNAASVEPLTARPGERLTGRDFRLRPVRTFALSGIVRDERGQPAAGITVVLSPTGAVSFSLPVPTLAGPQVKSGNDGRFTFLKIGEGDWDLLARHQSAGGVELRASIRIHLAGTDRENVVLTLAQPFALEVTSVWHDGGSADPVRGAPQVVLHPVEAAEGFRAYSGGRDSRQRINQVYRGRYRITAGVRPDDYLVAIRLGAEDVRGREVYLGPESPPIRVEYARNGGRISGRIENAKTCIVIIRPVEFDTPGIFDVLKCDASGAFHSDMKGPGRYRAWAFDRVDWDAWITPAFRDTLEQLATRVEVDAGVNVSVDLRLRSWPF